MKNEILAQLTTECPWRDTLYWYDAIDSTNTQAKNMAKQGAPHGTVVIAGSQSAGRGRMGRSFTSPPDAGLYLSVVLRPNCPAEALMHLTCAAAVAGCDAVEAVCGIRPDIKWTNDLVFGSKKLGGILTELSIHSATGLVDFAIIGIGINCSQSKEDFPPELQSLATSVKAVSGMPCSVSHLAAATIESLYKTDKMLLSSKACIMQAYRERCMTIGREISVVDGERIRHGIAIDLDENGGLLVAFADGTTETVSFGEVSIRGMYGYV